MSNSYFKFKQFTVNQEYCAMKVGIDGVLIGAWAPLENAKNILDIGTGTGLIALMLAQRSEALITAIDIDSAAFKQATENVNQSAWKSRIDVQHIGLQQFSANSVANYDLIVSNPPYFIDSLKAGTVNRTRARHTDSLTHQELIQHGKTLLNKTGRMCIILPVNEGFKCIEMAKSEGLFCSKLVSVYPKPTAIAKRLLIEFSKTVCTQEDSELTVESEQRHHYSPDFTELAKDFYLKL
jgi:tRNA1Val (adenine37-N6)-methyltransferase